MSKKRGILNFLPYLIVLIAAISLYNFGGGTVNETLSYTEMQERIRSEKIEESVLSIGGNVITVRGQYKEGEETKTFTATVPATDEMVGELLDDLSGSNISIVDAEESNLFLDTLVSMIPFVFVMLFGVWMMNRMAGGAGSNARAFEFGTSRAHLESDSKVRFIEPTLGVPVELGASGEMKH